MKLNKFQQYFRKVVFTGYLHVKCQAVLPTGAVAFSNAHFGPGTGPIYLDNLDCSGNESNLTDCARSSYVSCYYGHAEDAGVRCQGAVIS